MPFCSPDEAPLLAVFHGELSVLHRIHAEVDILTHSKIQPRKSQVVVDFKEHPRSPAVSDGVFLINRANESVEV